LLAHPIGKTPEDPIDNFVIVAIVVAHLVAMIALHLVTIVAYYLKPILGSLSQAMYMGL